MAASSSSSGVGHPPIDIYLGRVEALRNIGLPMTQVSKTLKISRSTLYGNLENTDMIGYTAISDQDLDEVIVHYKQTHPHDGDRMIIGYLCSLNIHLQRWRIRQSIHRVDPSGVRERSLKLIQRRAYFC